MSGRRFASVNGGVLGKKGGSTIAIAAGDDFKSAQQRLAYGDAATAVLPPKKPRPGGKVCPEAKPKNLVADTAIRAVGILARAWPELAYPLLRAITVHAVYLEFARAVGMKVPSTALVLEPYAGAGLDAFLGEIAALPFGELTTEDFGAAHEALSGYALVDGRIAPTNGRRANGVHFTPRSLTEPIVQKTLEPIFRAVSPEKTLDLRVCDPSVGSGAFLIEAARQIGQRVLDAGLAATIDEGKRLASIHCLYGVDICRFAVDSAKLALTLECRAERMPLDWLNDNLRCGDALVGLQNEQLARFHWSVDGKRKKGGDLEVVPEIDALIQRVMADGVAKRKARIASLSIAAKGAA